MRRLWIVCVMKVVPHGTHGGSPRYCQLQLTGPQLNGGHLLGALHWVAEVEGVPGRQEVHLHDDGTALQLKDGSLWNIVPAPPERSSAWPQQAQYDTLVQVQSMKPRRQPMQSEASLHSQPDAQQWLPSPPAQHPQWPQHQPPPEQQSKSRVQHAVSHMPALAQQRQPLQGHLHQLPPGLQSVPQELGQDAELPEQRQQALAYDMQEQQLQTKQQRLAAESRMLELDSLLGAALRNAAGQTGGTLSAAAAARPPAAAGRLRAPDSTWSSGSRMQQQPHSAQSRSAVWHAAPVAPAALQMAHSPVAVQPTPTSSTVGLSNSSPQPIAKQQRSGASRKSDSGSAWQSASQLLHGSPSQQPQLVLAAQRDQKPNGHVTLQPPALSPPGRQQVLSTGKIRVRLPQPAPKDAGKALPSPAKPGSQQLSTDEPQAKRQRVTESPVAAGPGPQLSTSSPRSHRAQKQAQQQAAGGAHRSLPPGLQSPPQHAVPPTQPSPASQRPQVQPQPQAGRPGTGTSSSLPPGLQRAAEPSDSKVQKAKAQSKSRQPRQQPVSTEPAARSATATAATSSGAVATKVTCCSCRVAATGHAEPASLRWLWPCTDDPHGHICRRPMLRRSSSRSSSRGSSSGSRPRLARQSSWRTTSSVSAPPRLPGQWQRR